MYTQDFFNQAMQAYANGKNDLAEELLVRAADQGNPQAVLYYADILYKRNAAEAHVYLAKKWSDGVQGTLHRSVLLSVFFENKPLDLEKFTRLYLEAQKGHVESLLILLNGFSAESKEFHCIYSLLVKYVPELAKEFYYLLNSECVANLEIDDLASAYQVFEQGFGEGKSYKILQQDISIGLKLLANVLSDIECIYLKLRFGGMLKPSLVVDPVSGIAQRDKIRTSSVVQIGAELLDWFTLAIERRIAKLADYPIECGEQLNLLHYAPGQQYFPHYDALLGDSEGLQALLKDGGQRVRTILCYLNTLESGGETYFPRTKKSVSAIQGNALIFDNVDPQGNVLKTAYHAGKVFEVGEKWVLTKWVRERKTRYGNIVYGAS
jgi:prolyl 4-hydroxylase